MPQPIQKDLRDVEKNKTVAALSYVWIASLYGLVFRRDSDFIQFHAKQGTALLVVELVSPFLLGPLAIVPILIAILLSLKGVYASLEGKYWFLPWIGSWLHDRSKS
ncbi:MAG: hypothetical protein V1846_01115 [Candidatus Komeilibacteria bacterium]